MDRIEIEFVSLLLSKLFAGIVLFRIVMIHLIILGNGRSRISSWK